MEFNINLITSPGYSITETNRGTDATVPLNKFILNCINYIRVTRQKRNETPTKHSAAVFFRWFTIDTFEQRDFQTDFSIAQETRRLANDATAGLHWNKRKTIHVKKK